MQAELRALRRENEVLAARVETLSNRVDLLTARAMGEGRKPVEPRDSSAPAEPTGRAARPSADPIVPPDLAVVRLAPEAGRPASAVPGRAARSPRVAPPIPTAVPIRDPDLTAVEALSRPGRRPLSAEAEGELREARALAGVGRAHALEDFSARYPQHPAADNALVEASLAYQAAGREEAACALSRRVMDEYPAGDAQSDAIEQVASCEARRGATESAQRLLARLRTDFPGTPAAQRAQARASQDSGSDGGNAPREIPARSNP